MELPFISQCLWASLPTGVTRVEEGLLPLGWAACAHPLQLSPVLQACLRFTDHLNLFCIVKVFFLFIYFLF